MDENLPTAFSNSTHGLHLCQIRQIPNVEKEFFKKDPLRVLLVLAACDDGLVTQLQRRF
jgi:hypothetical protein